MDETELAGYEIHPVAAIFPVLSDDDLHDLAEDIRIDLDRRDDPRATARLDGTSFVIDIDAEGFLQKLDPATIRSDTQQKGAGERAKLEAGRYLTTQFDAEKPQNVRIETTLKFDLGAGERRFSQERDMIQREVQKRAGGQEGAAIKARTQSGTMRCSA